MNLKTNFENIKISNNSIQPLPKINIKTIYDHVKNKKEKNIKMISLKEYLKGDKDEDKDEYELELDKIKESKKYFKKVNNNYKNRNKSLDVLPQYLKDVLTKQLKFHKQYENWIYIQRDSSTACNVAERAGGIVGKEG